MLTTAIACNLACQVTSNGSGQEELAFDSVQLLICLLVLSVVIALQDSLKKISALFILKAHSFLLITVIAWLPYLAVLIKDQQVLAFDKR